MWYSVALIFLIYPLVIHLNKRNTKIAFGVGVLIAIIITFFPFWELLGVFKSLEYYFDNNSINFSALLLRICTFGFMAFCIKYMNGVQKGYNETVDKAFKICQFGFVLYLMTVTNSFISSRLYDATRFLSIVIVADFFRYKKNRSLKLVCSTAVVCFCSLLLIKNINAYISEGHYIGISAWSYPYISVFNKQDIKYISGNSYMIDWIDAFPIE